MGSLCALCILNGICNTSPNLPRHSSQVSILLNKSNSRIVDGTTSYALEHSCLKPCQKHPQHIISAALLFGHTLLGVTAF